MRTAKYALLACVALPLLAFAGDRKWTGAALDGKWSTVGNWDGGRPVDANWDNVTLYGTNLVNGAIENDMGPMKLNSLQFRGQESFVFNTPSLIKVHTSGNAFYEVLPSLVYNGDLMLDSNSAGYATFYITGDFELNGTLEIADGMQLILSSYFENKTLDFNGPVNGPNGSLKMEVYTRSDVVNFNGKVTLARFESTTAYHPGTPHFKASGNEIGVFEQGYGSSYLDAENAFSTNTVITWSDSYRAGGGGNIRLAGRQQANRIVDENIDTVAIWTSDNIRTTPGSTAPVLTLYGTADALSKAAIADDVSIVWNPVGNFTQEFRDRNNSTTGSLVVSNGTLKIGGSSLFNNLTKVVAAGGTFEVATAQASLTGVNTLEVGNGGRFRIAMASTPLSARQADFIISGTGVIEVPDGMLLAAKSLTVDGTPQPDGLYGRVGNTVGATEVEWIEGDGLVAMSSTVPTVDTVSATWDGGASDDLASSSANWEGDVAPDFTTGGLVATFAAAGDSARFAQGGVLKGIVFDAADGFAVTAGDTLHLRQSGISTAAIEAETTRHYALNGPFRLDCSQTWQICNGVTLDVTGPLSHFTSSESLKILGTSSGDASKPSCRLYGANIFAGSIVLDHSKLELVGNGGRPAEINGQGGVLSLRGDLYGCLVLSNAVIRKPIEFVGGDKRRRIIVYGGTTNTISGTVTASSTPRFYINNKAELITEGGVSVTGGNWTIPSGDGRNSVWRIRERPLESTGVMQLAGVTMSLEAPGNYYKSASIGANSTIAFGCDWAISNSTAKANFTASTAMIDLCGYNQLTGELVLENGVDGATITSATPGIYGFTQTNDLVLAALNVTGAASLAKYGAGTVTLNRAVTSTGGLTVGEGVFTFGANGRWANSSNIVVKGTGKLIIPASNIFHRKTAASVDTADGACIELSDGVNMRLSSLTVDGSPLRGGIYGGASAPAGVTRSAAFSSTGSGVVRVGMAGCVLVIQ